VLLAYIIGFSLLGSLGSLVAAGLILAFPRAFDRFRRPFLAFALGTMLSVTFLDVLPDAVSRADPERVLGTTLLAFLVFFLGERFLHGHQPHDDEPVPALGRGAGRAVMIGDTIHNVVDGVVVTSAFLLSIPLGIATSVAIFAHEIPQELGDLSILLNSGYKPWQAYLFNFLSGLASLVGSLAAYAARDQMPGLIPYMLAIAAASFLYISASNLDPVVHHEHSARGWLVQTASLLLGVGTLYALQRLMG
jgi:zinc and cadmium transporter